MAYSLELAGRIRDATARATGVTEKRMFGGVAFLLDGHLLVGVWKDALVARLGPDEAVAALRERYVKRFDITGKPMKNWVMVEPRALETDEQLQAWLDRAWKFVETLPPRNG